MTEYLGGGMPRYSIACGEARKLEEGDPLKEIVSIYLDHVTVDGVEEEELNSYMGSI